MKAWTDYPIVELGDVPNQVAPVRECEILAYDGDKYCDVKVGGVITSFKSGYLYTKPGRCGEVPTVKHARLQKLRPLAGDGGGV